MASTKNYNQAHTVSDKSIYDLRKKHKTSYIILIILFFVMLQLFAWGCNDFLNSFIDMNYAKYFLFAFILLLGFLYIEKYHDISIHLISD